MTLIIGEGNLNKQDLYIGACIGDEILFQKGEDAARRNFLQSLDWNLLLLFHYIVMSKGVSEAARRLNKGQPSVSTALLRLEAHVGTSLCKRGPGGFKLTDAGGIVAKISAEIYGSVGKIPNALSRSLDELQSRVRLQLITNLVSDKVDVPLEKFHKDHSNVQLSISISTWDVIQRSVLQNEIEVGIGPASQHLPGLSYELLFIETYKPYCGKSHILNGQKISSPTELAGHGFILTGADEPLELTQFRKKWGIDHISGLSAHLEEARRMAELGVGICFLPTAFAEQAVCDGLLHDLADYSDGPRSSIFLITNPTAPSYPVRTSLIDYFRREI